MSALEAWKQRVAAHREQSHKIRSAMGVAGQDRWEHFSSFFKADPHRTDDVEVNRLAQEVTPATTLLDVGAGAGRFALPLALRCKHVTVVEPSLSMSETLRQLAAAAGIENITFVAPFVTNDVSMVSKAMNKMHATFPEYTAQYAKFGTVRLGGVRAWCLQRDAASGRLGGS